MCLFLPDKVSFKNALNVFEDFTKCSGLRVNMEKSEAIWNGPSSNYRRKPFKLKWTEMENCFGVHISNYKLDF
jgi:hypothetical protein